MGTARSRKIGRVGAYVQTSAYRRCDRKQDSRPRGCPIFRSESSSEEEKFKIKDGYMSANLLKLRMPRKVDMYQMKQHQVITIAHLLES